MTDIQKAVLDFMKWHLCEYHTLPSFQTICNKFHWGSLNSVHTHVNALKKKGHLAANGANNRLKLVNYDIQLVEKAL